MRFRSRRPGLLLGMAIGTAIGLAMFLFVFMKPQSTGTEGRFFELAYLSSWQSNGVYDIAYDDTTAQVKVKDGSYSAKVQLPGSSADVVVKDATVYLRTTSFESLYDFIGSKNNFNGLSSKLKSELKTFDNKWIRADLAMIKSQSPDIAAFHCGLALYEQLAKKDTKQWQALKDEYAQHQFLAVRDVATEPGKTTYTVALQPDEFAQFATAYESSDQYRELKRCNTVSFADAKLAEGGTLKVTFDTKKDSVARIEFPHAKADSGTALRVTPSGSSTSEIVIPKDFVDYDEFVERISTAVSAQ